MRKEIAKMERCEMKKYIIFAIILIMINGCGTVMDTEKGKADLMDVDRAFSKMSEEQGVYKAFDFYMDDDATLYRDRHHPFTGREAIRPILSKNTNGTLTWEPTKAEIAASGDLGYTLGSWTYKMKDSLGNIEKSYGHYISVWKKNQKGDWKWVFDSGISSPEEDNPEEG